MLSVADRTAASMSDPNADAPVFQREAIARILECLQSKRGSRRFLLADEVGLGKTHVARGVIDQLAECRRDHRRPLIVFYISSSREIAHQNRTKLASCDDGQQVDDRLTLFARHVRQARRMGHDRHRAACPVRLLTLTPGTSLFLGRNTGVREERLLLLYFVRQLRRRLFTMRCREAFRCGVRQKKAWRAESTWRRLESRFGSRMDGSLMRALRGEWSAPLRDLRELLAAGTRVDKGERNRVIGELRRGLAKAVTQALEPDLIVLDEFQRFRDVIEPRGANEEPGNERRRKNKKKERPEHILDDWFFPEQAGKSKTKSRPDTCPPVLLLSATPYRPYTTLREEAKDGSHLDQLFKVLRFVSANMDGGELERLNADLNAFSEAMTERALSARDDSKMLELKHRIEARLKRYMCRTERNWYYADERKGIETVPSGDGADDLPTDGEAREWRDLSRLLVEQVAEGAGQALDFWKSCPACLSFLSDEYRIRRTLKMLRSPQVRKDERRLLARIEDLPSRVNENFKFRRLLMALFGQWQAADSARTPPSATAERWPFLWCAPTYKYWSGGLFETGEGKPVDPTKFLIFSHWRFVPGAIGLLVSRIVEQALGCASRKEWERSEPLQFRADLSFGLFDVCFPSPGLAFAVDPFGIALTLHRRGRTVTLDDVRREARRKLEPALKKVGVRVGNRGSSAAGQGPGGSLWRVVARLDANHDWLAKPVREHRRLRSGRQRRRESHLEPAYLDKYREWMDAARHATGDIYITPRQFDRILEIALHSPALGLLRAVSRACPDSSSATEDGLGKWFGHALNAGLTGVRHYFNRPYARRIVDAVVGGRDKKVGRYGKGYAERVLAYCADAQLQAVLDEYAFLLAGQESKPEHRAARVADAITRVLTLGVGAPRVRVRSGGRKGWASHQGRSHFALAFAEESSEDGGGKSRRRHTREGFNSPFWPFVLATTSVGQEGLDFHWYCRDVVHWNVPSNPVDLEQREGRVNRRDGLVVRRSIEADTPLKALREDGEIPESLWSMVFRRVNQLRTGSHHDRHGLFPRWLYESRREPERWRIRRHVFHYSGSRDVLRYNRLKEDLATYRLVFGQANQEDLLARLRNKRASADSKRLEPYMLNLAPFKPGFAWKAAKGEASAHLADHSWKWLRQLLLDADKLLKKFGPVMGQDGLTAGQCLTAFVREFVTSQGAIPQAQVLRAAVAALVYLRNPYDDRFDIHRTVGFRDDARRLIEVARQLPRQWRRLIPAGT